MDVWKSFPEGVTERDTFGDAVVNKSRWRIVLWLLMSVVVLIMGWQARWALFPFAIGALLAYVLTPLIDRMAALVPAYSHQQNVVRRGFAVLFVYIVILFVCVAIGLMIVPVAIDQAVELVNVFPEQRTQAQNQVNEWLEFYREHVPEDARIRIDDYVASLGDDIGARLSGWSSSTFDILTTTLGVVFGFLVVPIWMFYALRDRHAFEHNFQAAIPIAAKPDILNGVRIADNLLGRYLRGQIFLGLVVGTAIFVGLTILDVELSIALAIFAPHRVKPNVTPHGCFDTQKTPQHSNAIIAVASSIFRLR